LFNAAQQEKHEVVLL